MSEYKQKILLATGIYPPDIGGPATYVKALEEALPGFGFEVKTITYGNCELGINNFELRIIDKNQNLFFRYLKYFWAVWNERKWVDLVYCFDQVSTGLPVALFKLLNPKKKMVIRIGGDFLWEKAYNNAWTEMPLSGYYKEKKNVKEKIYILIYRFVFARADKIIFSTDWQRNIILDYFDGLDNKCEVINNSFPKVKFDEQEKKVKGKNILFVGRLIGIKNLERLIDVVARIADLDVHLDIVGEGPLDGKLKAETERLNDRVRFLGNKSHEELFKIMRESYLLVVPSISEVSPNIVLEALKLGVPVIATKECGFYTKYHDQILFFNPLDGDDIYQKIIFLLDSDNYRRYLEGLKKINTSRSWQDVAREHDGLFRKLF